MTSINALNSGGGQYWMPPPPSGQRRDPMAAVADKLGLSSNDLRTELSRGQTLEDVATARGVSRDELISALQSGLPAGTTGTAEQLAAGKGTPPPPPPPPPPPSGAGFNSGMSDSSKLDELGRLLKMDSDEVARSAGSATDLVELLQSRGVDLGQLRNVLTSGDLLDVRA